MTEWNGLASDFDGTLADNAVVSRRTIAALEALRASGRVFILDTGRTLAVMRDAPRLWDRLDLCNVVIAENGAVIWDPVTDTVERVGRHFEDAWRQVLHREIPGLDEGLELMGGPETIATRAEAVIRANGLPLRVIRNKDNCMIMVDGVDKGTGLVAACARLGIPPSTMRAIGDGENDPDMFRVAGEGLAVATATDHTKAAAHRVTRGGAGEGVVEAITEMLAQQVQPPDREVA